MTSLINTLLDLLSRPGNAIRSGVVHGPGAMLPGLLGEVRTDGTELPGMDQLPDEGPQIGPVHLTPRTAAGFVGSAALDPLTYAGGAGGKFGARYMAQHPEMLAAKQPAQASVDFATGGLSRLMPEQGQLRPETRSLIERLDQQQKGLRASGPAGPAPLSVEEANRRYVLERGPAADAVEGRGVDELAPLKNEDWQAQYAPAPDRPLGAGRVPQGQDLPGAAKAPALSPEVERAATRYNDQVALLGRDTADAPLGRDMQTGEAIVDPIEAHALKTRRGDLVDAYSQVPGRNPFTPEEITHQRVANALFSSQGKFPPIIDRMRAGKFSDYSSPPPQDLFLPDGSLNEQHLQFALEAAENYLKRNSRDFEGQNAAALARKGRQVENFRQEGLLKRSPIRAGGEATADITGKATGTTKTAGVRTSRGGPAADAIDREEQLSRQIQGEEALVQGDAARPAGSMRTIPEDVELGSFERYGNDLPADLERMNWRESRVPRRGTELEYAGDEGMGLADETPVTKGRTLTFATNRDALTYLDNEKEIITLNEQIPEVVRSGDRTTAEALQSRRDALIRENQELVRAEVRRGGADTPETGSSADSEFSDVADGQQLYATPADAAAARRGPDALTALRSQNSAQLAETTRRFNATKGGKFQQRATAKARH